MANSDLDSDALSRLGVRLRAVRESASLTQGQVCSAMGMKGAISRGYLNRLEKGKLRNVSFLTLVRYLRACKAPIGKFMLELAQSGAFGEAEAESVRGFASEQRASDEQAKRAKAKLLYQKRWEREAQDADIIAGIWREIQVAIQPLLPADDPTRCFLAPYLEGVRAMYRAWKQAVRGAVNRDPTLDVQMAFDRIEQAGLEAKTIPAAVHKMREIVFERLMEMVPQGGKS